MVATMYVVPQPDRHMIRQALDMLVAPWLDINYDGAIEIRYGKQDLTHNAWFGTSPARLDECADFIANRNAEENNMYWGANPRKASTPTGRHGRDADVEVAFWHFADLDTEEASASLKERLDPNVRPTYRVLTGRTPHLRPHLYWLLRDPVVDMAAWTERQRGIAQTLGSDLVVINPSRIMRVPGTINWPHEKKRAKGYQIELVTYDEADRPPVTAEQIAQAYPVQKRSESSSEPRDGETTLSAMSKSKSEALIAECMSCETGGEWRLAMLQLTSHLMAIGTPWSVILALAPAITRFDQGYTTEETLRDMKKAMAGAADKYGIQPPDEQAAEEKAAEATESVFPLLTIKQLREMPPPEFIIDGLLTEHGFAFLYGVPGSGKSFLGISMSLALAYAQPWMGRETKKKGVLYIAAEGAAGLGKRVDAWLKKHGINEDEDAPFLILPVAVQMLVEMDVKKLLRTIDAARAVCGFEVSLVVIDTVSRSITGADENGQEAMSAFVHACGIIQQHIDGAVLGIHHSGKDQTKGMRGSTVLIGACDTSMLCEGDMEQLRCTLTVEKQKDAEMVPPIEMSMEVVPLPEKGLSVTSLVPTLDTPTQPVREEPETRLDRQQRVRVLEEVKRAFDENRPMTNSDKKDIIKEGRYLPRVIAMQYGIRFEDAKSYVQSWVDRGILVSGTVPGRGGKSGLRITSIPEDWR